MRQSLNILDREGAALDRQQRAPRGVERPEAFFDKSPPSRDLEALRILLGRNLRPPSAWPRAAASRFRADEHSVGWPGHNRVEQKVPAGVLKVSSIRLNHKDRLASSFVKKPREIKGGERTLTPSILVRIQVPQPIFSTAYW
jgi:hypothetical protein